MNLPKRFYTVGWLLVGLAMAVLEGLAAVDKDTGDTLSEHVWSILDYHPIIWWVGFSSALLIVSHIFFKWPSIRRK